MCIRDRHRTVWGLQEQLQHGKFRPESFEVSFGGGRIDRVDVMEEENQVYVKVIDYKTGNTTFDLVYLYYGLQLQLMIYLDGALSVEKKKYPGKEVLPAGVFYYNVKDPMIKEKIDADVEAVSSRILKELKMNGLVRADREMIEKMDRSLAVSYTHLDVYKRQPHELPRCGTQRLCQNRKRNYFSFLF